MLSLSEPLIEHLLIPMCISRFMLFFLQVCDYGASGATCLRCTNSMHLHSRGCISVCPGGTTAFGDARDGRECQSSPASSAAPATVTVTAEEVVPNPFSGNLVIALSTSQVAFDEAPNCMMLCYSIITTIGGGLNLWNNEMITTLGTHFQSLVSVGAYFEIIGNDNLASFGTAFRRLTRITGTIAIKGNNAGLTDFENVRTLGCHGGVYSSSSYPDTDYCEGCPSWLINLPRC